MGDIISVGSKMLTPPPSKGMCEYREWRLLNAVRQIAAKW